MIRSLATSPSSASGRDITVGGARSEVVAAVADCVVDEQEPFGSERERVTTHETPRHWLEVDEVPLIGSGEIEEFRSRDQRATGRWANL